MHLRPKRPVLRLRTAGLEGGQPSKIQNNHKDHAGDHTESRSLPAVHGGSRRRSLQRPPGLCGDRRVLLVPEGLWHPPDEIGGRAGRGRRRRRLPSEPVLLGPGLPGNDGVLPRPKAEPENAGGRDRQLHETKRVLEWRRTGRRKKPRSQPRQPPPPQQRSPAGSDFPFVQQAGRSFRYGGTAVLTTERVSSKSNHHEKRTEYVPQNQKTARKVRCEQQQQQVFVTGF
mmetsp:Transcript_7270/g.14937  ORF Transcript_7270/g.14937 Transcript_7270/m.14937 type:complete len:228 (-) Transcript_7270:1546-2229(-)